MGRWARRHAQATADWQAGCLSASAGPHPAHSSTTKVFVSTIVETFWMGNNCGFASAMSVVLFVMVVVLAWLPLRLDHRVHYQ